MHDSFRRDTYDEARRARRLTAVRTFHEPEKKGLPFPDPLLPLGRRGRRAGGDDSFEPSAACGEWQTQAVEITEKTRLNGRKKWNCISTWKLDIQS